MSTLPAGWAEAALGEWLPLSYGKGLTEASRKPGPYGVYGSSGLVGAHSHPLTSGPTLIVGRKGSVGRVHLSAGPCWPIDTAYFVEATADRNLRFARYLLESLQLGKLDRSTAIPGLTRDDYSATVVPLPPLPEQSRIVSEIEKQFTRLDAGVVALKRLQSHLKRYRASVLKAACEGRLVPTEAELARREGRDYEPAEKLLARILEERRAKWEADQLAKMKAAGKVPKDDSWRTKYEEPAGAPRKSLGSVPVGWAWATVSQLGPVSSGNTPKGIERRIAGAGEIPWFKVSDMNRPTNQRVMGDSDSWLSLAAVQELAMRVHAAGSIVFPKRGGAIATNKKRALARPSCLDLNCMAVEPHPAIAAFLWWWFAGLDLGALGDGSNVPQINHGDIIPLQVPLPPLSEQARIVAEVEARLSVVEEAGSSIATVLRRSERLRQSILKLAFEGKLVPQDPRDEPAIILLNRIRLEQRAEVEVVGPARARQKKADRRIGQGRLNEKPL